MLTSCWSRDISKRGLIKLPPCGWGGARGRGVGEDSDAIGGSARDDKTESTRSRCAPRLYRPPRSPSWSLPARGSSPLLNFNKPISNTLQLPGHVESSGERKGVSMTVDGGRIREMEILRVVRWVFFFFFKTLIIVSLLGRQVYLFDLCLRLCLVWCLDSFRYYRADWYYGIYILFFLSCNKF